MLVNGPIGGCGVGEFLSAPVMFQRGNENLKTPPQAPALMVEMSHCYKTLRAKKDCAEQTTIKQLLSHAGDNHQGSNMSQHAKTRSGVGGIPLQNAHAAMHREVELTERRLEASSKPSRVEEVWRKKARETEKLQIEEKRRVKRSTCGG